MKQGKLIVALLLVILVVFFAIHNTEMVMVDLIFSKVKVQMVLVILICLLLGAIIGLVASMSALAAQRRENKQLKKDYDQLHQTKLNEVESKDRELAELRAKLTQNDYQNKNTAVFNQEGAYSQDIADIEADKNKTGINFFN
ncbi:lipopolysaccharide assembly protein LapA domain-containing protein [Vaginisenegalia massiliensis]|uniref:lipopolysaccharide assembly protein LapA domain-containing protein n=1 Tax=Vaginisenegalia massiliensis TaxID=2058294 RepID=UPI000F531755|nr:LapA family protein [Vaginisenegalia massiliensis]